MPKENLIVIARIKAKPGMEEVTKAELQKLVAPTLVEEGCIKYDLHESTTEPTEFVFYEIWESQEALDKHSQSEHLRKFRAERDAFIVGPPEVTRWRAL